MPSNLSTSEDSPQRRACPACSGHLALTWQRPIDRLATKLVAIRRYRCQSACCQWEGNFRIEQANVRHMFSELPVAADAAAHAATLRRSATVLVLGRLLLALCGTAPTRAAGGGDDRARRSDEPPAAEPLR